MCMLGSESTKAGEESGMCAFELTIDALSRAVNDMIGQMDCGTQHMK